MFHQLRFLRSRVRISGTCGFRVLRSGRKFPWLGLSGLRPQALATILLLHQDAEDVAESMHCAAWVEVSRACLIEVAKIKTGRFQVSGIAGTTGDNAAVSGDGSAELGSSIQAELA